MNMRDISYNSGNVRDHSTGLHALNRLSCWFTFMVIFVLLTSCLNRQFVEGHVRIYDATTESLNDSSLFYGYVYQDVGSDTTNAFPISNARVWVDKLNINAFTGHDGYYEILVAPANLVLKCQKDNNEWLELVEKTEALNAVANEKRRVDFYLGTTIE